MFGVAARGLKTIMIEENPELVPNAGDISNYPKVQVSDGRQVMINLLSESA